MGPFPEINDSSVFADLRADDHPGIQNHVFSQESFQNINIQLSGIQYSSFPSQRVASKGIERNSMKRCRPCLGRDGSSINRFYKEFAEEVKLLARAGRSTKLTALSMSRGLPG